MTQEQDNYFELTERDLGKNLPHDSGYIDHSTTTNPVNLYLKEISKEPLLTFEQEQTLARTIEAGKIAAEKLESADLFDDLQLNTLHEQICAADMARNKFIEANLRWVVNNAKRKINRGVSLLDLIQEGNIGLMHAVEKFDYRKGLKFSTYATGWIRQAIGKAIINQSRTMHVPANIAARWIMMEEANKVLTQQSSKIPSSEELAEELGVNVKEINIVQRAVTIPISLESTLGRSEESPLSDAIEGDSPYPADLANEHLLQSEMRDLLESSNLDKRELLILHLRYGFDGHRARTLDEVKTELGDISRETVRHVEKEALIKLQNPATKRYLKDYLE